jgi:hypothetical protein
MAEIYPNRASAIGAAAAAAAAAAELQPQLMRDLEGCVAL